MALRQITVAALAIIAAAIASGCAGKCNDIGDKKDSTNASSATCINRTKLGVVFDRFDRNDNTSSLGAAETGQNWSVTAGVFGINANRAYTPTGVAGFAITDGNENTALAQVGLPVMANDCGLVVRFVDSNNYWFLYNNNGVYRFAKVVAGALTNIASFDRASDPVPKNNDTLAVDLAGDDLTPMVNGVQSSGESLNDSTHTLATRNGFGCRTGSNQVRFDDFEVLKPNQHPTDE